MDLVRSYIDRVLELRRQRENDALTDAELEQIALGAGLSSEDLAEARKEIAASIARGEGFLRHANWERSVHEFENAVALSPNRSDALAGLALSLWNHGCQDRDAADRHRAMQFAERALQIDPSNDEVIGLVTHMTEHPDQKYPVMRAGGFSMIANTTANEASRSARRIVLVIGISIALVGAMVPIIFLSVDTPKEVTITTQTPMGTSTETITIGGGDVDLQLGRNGVGSEGLDDARHAGVDGEGRIYVGEYGSGRVQVFDPEGEVLAIWTIPSNNPITGMAVEPNGTLWAIAEGSLRRFNAVDGTPIDELAPDFRPYSDVAPHPTGGAVAIGRGDRGRTEMIVFGSDGSIEQQIPDPVGRITETIAVIPMVAAATDGTLYVLDRHSKGVYVYRPDGTYLDRFGSSDGDQGLRSPTAITVDRLGRVLVSDILGIKIYTKDGEFVGTIPVSGVPFGLAVDSRNRLWAAMRTYLGRFEIPS